MKNILTVTYPFDVNTFDKTDRKIELAAGCECAAGGAGFGGRELCFELDSQAARDRAEQAIKSLGIRGLEVL